MTRTGMRNRTRMAGIVATLVLALGGMSLTVFSTAAAATGEPTLTATPSDNLNDQTAVQVSLSGATDYNGQTVYFAECNEASEAATGHYNSACSDFHHTKTVTNGAGTDTIYVSDGPINDYTPAPTCTPADNGDCTMAALVQGDADYTEIASVPITFGTPTLTASSPTTNLDDGSGVAVSLTGVPSGTSVSLEECDTGAANPTYACATLASGTADSGGYSTTVHVVYGKVGTGTCDETKPANDCVIQAAGYGDSAAVPISFEAPNKTYTVSPSTGLKDGQEVAVAVSDLPSQDAPTYIAECNTTDAEPNGNYDESLSACAAEDAPTLVNGGFSTTFDVVDGPLYDTDGPACDHSNSPDGSSAPACAILLLQEADAAPYDYRVIESKPITFRPPVTGPAAISLSKTTYLTGKTNVTFTATDVPDGVTDVYVMECTRKAVATQKYESDENCATMSGDPEVNDNAITATGQFPEGFIAPGSTCDVLHACQVALFENYYVDNGDSNEREEKLISSWVPIWFESPAESGPPAAPSPSVSGSSRVGTKDTCSIGSVPSYEVANYAWVAGSAVVGSGTSIEVPGKAYGKPLECAATLTNALGTGKVGVSKSEHVKLGKALREKGPIYVESPYGPTTGHTVKAAGGTWKPRADSFSYQWYLGKKKIHGATHSKYKIPKKDKGKTLWCRVTGHAHGYEDGTAKTLRVQVS